jgi:hypothetical protein
MKAFTLPLLGAVAISVIAIASATAMPFSSNNSMAVLEENLVQDVRLVCDRRGRCWNTGRRSARGYYSRPGYYAEPGYGYYREPGYGYYRGGPRVGIGIGPFGFGMH